jgi:hypothetical protein
MNDTLTPRTNASKTKAIKNGFSPLIYYCYANDMAKLEYELTAVTDQRDRLAEALWELRDAEWLNMPGRANDIVEAALATLNQPAP